MHQGSDNKLFVVDLLRVFGPPRMWVSAAIAKLLCFLVDFEQNRKRVGILRLRRKALDVLGR